MIGTTLFAVMGLYVALVSVGCTQLQKIQAALIDIKQQGASEMNRRLVECVEHHQHVLRSVMTSLHLGRAPQRRRNASPVRHELGFYIPEGGNPHSHRRENLKSYIALTGWTL
jgi:hypothetical protein